MIRIFNDPESVCCAAADLFVQLAQEAVRDHGSFKVALSGGQTPKRVYELLAESPRRERISWPDVHVFWGDERCVPDDDPRNNALMARLTLLSRVPVDMAHVHPIRCAADVAAEAARYQEVLRTKTKEESAVPVLDLVFLGLGLDGHTASLFPGSSALQEKQCWVVGVTEAAPKVSRVTLTPIILNAARRLVFLVFGREKAEVVHSVLEGPIDYQRLPAQLIQPVNGKLIWLLDQQAASLLNEQGMCQEEKGQKGG